MTRNLGPCWPARRTKIPRFARDDSGVGTRSKLRFYGNIFFYFWDAADVCNFAHTSAAVTRLEIAGCD